MPSRKTPQRYLGTQWPAVVVHSVEPSQAVWPALGLEHECQVRELVDSSSSSGLQVREPQKTPQRRDKLPLSFPGMDRAVKNSLSLVFCLGSCVPLPMYPPQHPHCEARKQFPECWPDMPKALGSVPSIGCV